MAIFYKREIYFLIFANKVNAFIMRKIGWMLLMGVCSLFVACGSGDSEDKLTIERLEGVWKLQSWTGEAQNPDGTSYTFSDLVYVYVVLNADNTFTLYQNIGYAGAVKLTGSCQLTSSEISGYYHTGVAGMTSWSDSYLVSNVTTSTMTWTATHDANDVQQFVKVLYVPQEVIDETETKTRSSVEPVLRGVL
jgi:hypothetical protein